MGAVKNFYHDEIVRNGIDPEDCPECDGLGNVWNNADPTSGQRVDCEVCGGPNANRALMDRGL